MRVLTSQLYNLLFNAGNVFSQLSYTMSTLRVGDNFEEDVD